MLGSPGTFLQQGFWVHLILESSFLSCFKLARLSLSSSLFDSHCRPLYLLGFCYPASRKAEACEVWPVWRFIYLSLTNYTDLFCFKNFIANSSGKNTEEKNNKRGKVIKVTAVYTLLSLTPSVVVLDSYEGKNWRFPFEFCPVILLRTVGLMQMSLFLCPIYRVGNVQFFSLRQCKFSGFPLLNWFIFTQELHLSDIFSQYVTFHCLRSWFLTSTK